MLTINTEPQYTLVNVQCECSESETNLNATCLAQKKLRGTSNKSTTEILTCTNYTALFVEAAIKIYAINAYTGMSKIRQYNYKTSACQLPMSILIIIM